MIGVLLSFLAPSKMIYFLLLAPVLLGYLVLVRTLRYRRIDQIQKQHGHTPTEFEKLNYRDAQTIIGQLASPQWLTFPNCI
jgi:hypothetical protein